MLTPVREVERFAATSPQPHSVAIDRDRAYIASRATKNIDVIDVNSWRKIDEILTPGMPWGLTFAGGELVMTCGETEDDHRFVRRYVPGEGWLDIVVPCPDDTGSHLAIHNGKVLLGQWYNKKLLVLDEAGAVERAYDAPHGIAGVAVRGDVAYVLGTDEDAGDYYISSVDLRDGRTSDLATVPFHARGLSYDGERWWTNFRENDQVVVFALPS